MQPAVTHLLRWTQALHYAGELIIGPENNSARFVLDLKKCRFPCACIWCTVRPDFFLLGKLPLSSDLWLAYPSVSGMSIFTIFYPLDLSRRSKVCLFYSSKQNVVEKMKTRWIRSPDPADREFTHSTLNFPSPI